LPNWCHNVLTLSGSADEIDAFAKKARPTPALKRHEYDSNSDDSADASTPPFEEWFGERYAHVPLTFEAFAPQPEDVSDWYSWRCEHWGTKWDASFGEPSVAIPSRAVADLDLSVDANGLVRTPTALIYRFETAWSPPVAVVAAMSDQHPRLTFLLRYGEPGDGFAGEAEFVDGELVRDTPLPVSEVLAPEEMWY
jgi:hypothetical protein